MSKHSHTFVGRLQTAKKIIKVSIFEITSWVQDMSCFKDLPFFNLDLISIEKLPNHQQNLQWGVRDLKDYIWKQISKAKVDEIFKERLK